MIALFLSVRLLLANIYLTWQRCGNLKAATFLWVLWKYQVDGKGPNQCLNWKLLINWDGSRLSCHMPWLTCINCAALNHLAPFMEMLQGLWGGRGVTLERFWGQKPHTHGQPAVGPFCCLWKQSFVNRHGNSFAVCYKVLSCDLCFAAHLFGVFSIVFPCLSPQFLFKAANFVSAFFTLSSLEARRDNVKSKILSNNLCRCIWKVSVTIAG